MNDSSDALAVIFFGLSMMAIGFAMFIPYWSGAVIDFTSAPETVQTVFQATLVILFFGFLLKVVDNA